MDLSETKVPENLGAAFKEDNMALTETQNAFIHLATHLAIVYAEQKEVSEKRAEHEIGSMIDMMFLMSNARIPRRILADKVVGLIRAIARHDKKAEALLEVSEVLMRGRTENCPPLWFSAKNIVETTEQAAERLIATMATSTNAVIRSQRNALVKVLIEAELITRERVKKVVSESMAKPEGEAELDPLAVEAEPVEEPEVKKARPKGKKARKAVTVANGQNGNAEIPPHTAS